MVVTLLVAGIFIEHEVQNANSINGFQFEVPVAALDLLTNGERGVEHTAVFEKTPCRFLHFDDELLTPVVLAIHIKQSLAPGLEHPQLLRIQIGHVHDVLFFVEQRVQEADEQVFVHRRAK